MRRSARNPTVLPAGRSEWAQHYVIDAADPPTIREVIDAYANSNAQARQPFDDSGDLLPMAHYTLAEVMRDVRPGNYLRYGHATPKFRALKGQLRRRGQRVPLMIEVDRKGVAQVGEGNHRVAALLAMYGPAHRVGVRFVYNRYPIETPAGVTWATADRDAVARRAERNGGVRVKIVDSYDGFDVWLHPDTDANVYEDGELVYGRVSVREPRDELDSWCDRSVGRVATMVKRNLDVLVVHETMLHRSLRGKGNGLAMYLAALKYAAKRPTPAALVTDSCDGGETSALAADVWDRLRNVPGVVVWGHRGTYDNHRPIAAFWQGVPA